MTATATTVEHGPALARPSLGRLTKLELRKMVDTRAGFWLLLATAGLTAAVVTLVCVFGNDRDRTLNELLSAAVQPCGALLPIIGILLVTSEWSQRTALTTLTLVPDRNRVLTAKVLAGLTLAIVALAVSFVVAALGAAIVSPNVDHVWSLEADRFGQVALFLALAMTVGVAFGAAILASAPAIVLSFVLPIGVMALNAIPSLDNTMNWIDTSAQGALPDHLLDGTEWAQLGTTVVLWLILPMAIGVWRIGRSEVGTT